MARQARGEYLDPHQTQIVHAINRCVRRAFLCGNDPYSGKSYEHRRQWMRDRLEFLASVFAVECLTYSLMSSHIHLILRNRPDIANTWSADEVARRWLMLCPKRKSMDGSPKQPNESELRSITGDANLVEKLRTRLSDISWWMRFTAEKIARQANSEDRCTGRFWAGRFRAVPLLDEASLLACAIYVDLNPIRAALAETPEQSQFTGAKDRLDDLSETIDRRKSKPKSKSRTRNKQKVAPQRSHQWERSRRRRKSGWLSPIEIDEQYDSVRVGPGSLEKDRCESGRRASNKGFLSLPLIGYLKLLDWTGRQVRQDKRGSIPVELAPILDRLGIESKSWCRLIGKFSSLFRRVVGNTESISNEAHRRNQSWMHAPGVACFK